MSEILCNEVKDAIGFSIGELPVRYLGLPLTSTRLYYKDCLPLIERVTKRIQSWTGNLLSYAGRIKVQAHKQYHTSVTPF